MRLASLAENAFNAVERIQEYSVAPEEPPAEIPGSCPDSWPTKGEVNALVILLSPHSASALCQSALPS